MALGHYGKRNIMADDKLTNMNPDDLTPEGKMELQFRVLGNEMI